MAPPVAPLVIPVELGERRYDVLVGTGLVRHLVELCPPRLGGRMVVVTDTNVEPVLLPSIEAVLRQAGRWRGAVVVPAGEQSKSFSDLEVVCRRLLQLGVERDDVVVALGGGVIGDLAGFAASILRRGVALIQIPTTLLALVDSSVGGKTGINTGEGKNLIGAFHQPSLVIADPDVLSTLPQRHMRAGYAEIVKYALLGDRTFFEWLETNGRLVVGRDPDALRHAIATSIAMKAAIVAQDERETGRRALLNLGHTFGHALEAFAGFSDRLLHGEAVSIGMCLAGEFSEHLGRCRPGTTDRVRAHLAALGLYTSVAEMPGRAPAAEECVDLMMQDKKIRSGRLTFLLLRDIGDAVIERDVGRRTVERFLAPLLDRA